MRARGEHGLVQGWASIIDEGISLHTSEPFGEPMRREPTVVAEVKYSGAAEDCGGVRDQAPMTPVPERFGAHDRDSVLSRLR